MVYPIIDSDIFQTNKMSDRIVDIIVKVMVIGFLSIWFYFMKLSMGFENAVLFAFAITVSELWSTKQNKDE